MALGNAARASFLKTHEGKIYLSSDKEYKNPSDYVSGIITDLSLVDLEYEGTKYRALMVTISDQGESYKLQIRENSGNYRNLISFLKNIDLKEPVQINAVPSEGKKGKVNTSLTVTDPATGNWVKGFYKKGSEHELPAVTPITDKKGETIAWDSSEQQEFLENVLNKDLKPQLSSVPQQSGPAQTESKPSEEVLEEDSEYSDELPF